MPIENIYLVMFGWKRKNIKIGSCVLRTFWIKVFTVTKYLIFQIWARQLLNRILKEGSMRDSQFRGNQCRIFLDLFSWGEWFRTVSSEHGNMNTASFSLDDSITKNNERLKAEIPCCFEVIHSNYSFKSCENINILFRNMFTGWVLLKVRLLWKKSLFISIWN